MTDVASESVAPVSTPHWGAQSGVAFTVRAKVNIVARPQPVLDALLDTSTWPQWNKFIPGATLSHSPNDAEGPQRLRSGTLFTEYVDMAGRGRPTIIKMKLLMTILEEIKETDRSGYRVVWLGKGYPNWALRSERVHEIMWEAASEETVYNVYETFSGPLAWAVRVFVGKTLVKRFGQWNAELKAFVEGRE